MTAWEVSTVRPWALAVDAATFLVSAPLLARVPRLVSLAEPVEWPGRSLSPTSVGSPL